MTQDPGFLVNFQLQKKHRLIPGGSIRGRVHVVYADVGMKFMTHMMPTREILEDMSKEEEWKSQVLYMKGLTDPKMSFINLLIHKKNKCS